MSNRRGFISLTGWAIIAIIILALLAICLRNCRMILHPQIPRPPRIVTYGPYEVIRADSGASLAVKAGTKRRPSDRQITLQGVAAPAEGKWVDVSRDHLRQMAGGSVTVRAEKHGPFRGEDEYGAWLVEHKKDCEQCRRSFDENPDISMCEVAFYKLQEILRQGMIEVDCSSCGGTGKIDGRYCFLCSGDGRRWGNNPEEVEARVPTSGVVIGQSGIVLQEAQLEGGYVKCAADAPKEWLAAEEAAKKAKKGVWSK